MNNQERFREWVLDAKAVQRRSGQGTFRWFIYNSLKDKKNLHIFAAFFFPHIVTSELAECHFQLMQTLSSQTSKAIIFPRGFGKSTIMKIDTLHDIVYGLEPVILYVSNILRDASFHFESIKSELENNEMLKWVYGDLVPQNSDKSRKWTNVHFEAANGVNLVARGAGKGRGVNIKNKRPTKIIFDDIEDDELVRSTDRLVKLKTWVKNVIVPSKDPERGRVIWVGTLLSPFSALQDFYDTYGGLKRAALEDSSGAPALDGFSIWPEGRSKEWLIDEKSKIGTFAFSQEYLNLPMNSETQIFHSRHFRAYDPDDLPEALMFFTTVDLAISEKTSADFTCVMTVGVASDGRKFVVRYDNERLSPSATIQKIRLHNDLYRPLVIGIESNQYQSALSHFLKKEMAATRQVLPIKEIISNKNKQAKIRGLEPFFEKGEIYMLEDQDQLKFQLYHFPQNDHDDIVDALAMQVELWRAPSLNYRAIKQPQQKGLTLKQALKQEGLLY